METRLAHLSDSVAPDIEQTQQQELARVHLLSDSDVHI